MYEIAQMVTACLHANTIVSVAWVVDAPGFGPRDRAEALALTPGGGRVGAAMDGALDDQLSSLANAGIKGRLLDLQVSDMEALVAGLANGGNARCLLVDAVDLPGGLWARLAVREPLCLVTRLDGDEVVGTELFTAATIRDAGVRVGEMFSRGVSATAVLDDTVVTVMRPIPTMLVAGPGPIAAAIASAAQPLGWRVQTATNVSAAAAVAAQLCPLDKVVVLGHDIDLAGPVLAAALSSEAGYIGALGAQRTQRDRVRWLADRGVTDLSRVHGPAGLDIGATSPAEIAISVLAEALAVSSDTTAAPIRNDLAADDRGTETPK